jgi:hypothetical protein
MSSIMSRILFWNIAKHVRICQLLCLDYLRCLEFYFEVLLNMLEFYFEVFLNMLQFYFEVLLLPSIMSGIPYMSRILFWCIAKHIRILCWSAKHVRILFWSIVKQVRICQVLCLDYLTCLEFYF